jgi:hypothetical protein
MSAFAIFVLVVTVLYVIYYSVIIMKDLYKKDDINPAKDEEDIDVSQMQDTEEPTPVSEDAHDLQERELYDASQDEQGDIAFINNEEDAAAYQQKIQKEERPPAAEECARLQESMESVDIDSTGATDPDLMVAMLLNQKPGGPKIFQTRMTL